MSQRVTTSTTKPYDTQQNIFTHLPFAVVYWRRLTGDTNIATFCTKWCWSKFNISSAHYFVNKSRKAHHGLMCKSSQWVANVEESSADWQLAWPMRAGYVRLVSLIDVCVKWAITEQIFILGWLQWPLFDDVAPTADATSFTIDCWRHVNYNQFLLHTLHLIWLWKFNFWEWVSCTKTACQYIQSRGNDVSFYHHHSQRIMSSVIMSSEASLLCRIP